MGPTRFVFEGMAAKFRVEVMEGDPATITVAWIAFYIEVAVAAIIAVQCVHTRRSARRLQDLYRDDD